jgi:predicted nucleic acid-binding protein
MIVADSNLVAYLLLPGPLQATASDVLRKDPRWFAPPLWQSEFRNILFAYIRTQGMSRTTALAHWESAMMLLGPNERSVDAARVIEKSDHAGLSAYHAEFVVLAEELDAPLVTSDKVILKAFPARALTPGAFLRK